RDISAIHRLRAAMHNSNFCHDETLAAVLLQNSRPTRFATDHSTKFVSNPRSLLDHLVRNGEQSWGDREPKLLASNTVEDQLGCGGLLDRNLGGLGALEDEACVDPSLTIGFRDAGAIAHQSTAGHEFTPLVDRWKRVPCGEGKHLCAAVVEHRISGNEQCIHALRGETLEGDFHVDGSIASGFLELKFEPHLIGRCA